MQGGGFPQSMNGSQSAQAPYPAQPAQPGWPQQAVQPYAQQPSSQPAWHQQPPQQHAMQPQPQSHAQASQPAPSSNAPGISMGLGGFGVGLPGVGGLGNVNTAALNKRVNSMSPAMVFVFFVVAIAVGFLFDVVFTFVHIPYGRYIWYATTVLPFAGAGMLGALWTRAGKTAVITAAVIASLVYGACDIGLGVVLGGGGGISLAYIINLAAFSIGISLFGGVGGAIRGAKQKESVTGG
jgi:hypothetical protein